MWSQLGWIALALLYCVLDQPVDLSQVKLIVNEKTDGQKGSDNKKVVEWDGGFDYRHLDALAQKQVFNRSC
jgi:hypothetical protein